MFKPVALLVALTAAFAAPVALAAAPSEPTRIEHRYLEQLSYTGTTQLVRALDAELVQGDGEVIDSLKLYFSEYSLWNLQAAAGLALRSDNREDLVPLPAGSYFTSTHTRLSKDGRILALAAGKGGQLDALRWQRGGKLERLVPAAQAWRSGVSDMSADGKTITGWLLADKNALPRGFVWTEQHGFSLLPETLSVPLAISADGTTLVGDSYRGTLAMLRQRMAVQTFENEAPLADNPRIKRWEIVGVSDSGRRLAGFVQLANAPVWQGFLWDAESGFVTQAKPAVLRHKGKGTPDLAAFSRRVLAVAGMSEAQRLQFLQTDALRWHVTEGLSTLQANASVAGLSRDGSTTLLHAHSGNGQHPLWQLTKSGTVNLNKAVGNDDAYLNLLALSEDGRRMWLTVNNDSGSHTVLLEDARLPAFPPALSVIAPQVFSADARRMAGGGYDTEQGYPTLHWTMGTATPQQLNCPGEDRSSSRYVLSGDGKVVGAGQYDNGLAHICLFGPLP